MRVLRYHGGLMEKQKTSFGEIGIFMLLVAIIILVPLIFSGRLADSFELPKLVIFRSLISLAAILFLLQTVKRRKIPLPAHAFQNITVIGFILLTLTLAVSSLFSIAPETSFFGTDSRLQGALSLFHYAMFFWIVAWIVNTENKKKAILTAVAMVGTVIALLAILQKSNLDPFFSNWEASSFFGRAFSTIGHPNMLAGFLLLTIGGTLGVLQIKFSTIKSSMASILLLAACLFQITALIFTESRSGLLGLFALFLTFSLLSLKGVKKILVPCVVIIFSFIIFAITAPERIPLEGENARSIISRTAIWQGALGVFLERPLVGNGLETFAFSFPAHEQNALFKTEILNQEVDRAHNEFLDVLTQTGIPGFIAYLVFLISLLYISIKQKNRTMVENGAISAIIGLLVINQFNFSTTVHFVFFALFAGILLQSSTQWTIHEFKKSPSGIALVMIGLFMGNIFFFNINPLFANYYYQKSLQTKELQELKKAAALDPFRDEYALSLAQSYLEAKKYDEGLAALAKMKTPSALYYVIRGTLLTRRGFLNDDPDDLALGIKLFEEAKARYPSSPFLLKAYGDALSFLQLYEEAIREYEKYLTVVPDFWKWSAEDLAQKTTYEQTRFRHFFQDNPDFKDIFIKLGAAYQAIGAKEKAEYYGKILP